MIKKLNVGCGKRPLKGFVNLDIIAGDGVDVVADAKHLPWKDSEFDLVYACHVLEHFSKHETEYVLKEWTRVLKPGGILRLAVPDFASCVKWYLDNDDITSIQGLVCGGHKCWNDAHKVLFDINKLNDLFEKQGLINIRIWNWRNILPEEHDDFSKAYLPHLDFDGQLMSLNLEGEKA